MPRSDAVQNRQQIMEAFHKATRRKVTRLPTMSEIVKLSGLGRGTVYRHFPDPGTLAFSFMSTGYEALFAQTRESLQKAGTVMETRDALEDHLYRYRAYNKENLNLLTAPEVVTSSGCDLAQTSQRQCVRRALRDMAGIGKTSPEPLETATDLIARCGDPLHLSSVGLSQDGEDHLANSAIKLAMEIADHVTLQLRRTT
ncbi:TetR/AcrR family transcriptional regulator [Sneathiella glossodoripedis]|uniref:TetR/AcrR family transcriptional regulator n=1 Tax=Sneathiella glossodoripedis TaxID=418853 RepID=UPI0004714B74|nr:TetR/AcrR family transcriptional regulator [Sneathiella glossodoripedis]